ncbi:MAG: transporter [Deltaproteobacteria bacterium]|nr:transporter [Deltaproteobacteria bacterium]
MKRRKGMKHLILCTAGFLMMTTVAFAGHPLVTDDTGTAGKGNGQVEIGVAFFHDKDEVDEATTIEAKGGETAVGFAVGFLENLDIVLGVPYIWFHVDENDVCMDREDGLSDISLDLKWRFFERDGWSVALKPGISLPTGDDDKGLGAGRAAYRMFFISTKEFEPAAVHLNLGYIRNENKADERLDLWHVSVAAEVEVVKDLKLLSDVGVERSPVKGSDNHPSFALAGLSYDVSERITLDMGIRFGLTSSEDDVQYLVGMTINF